jgi:hypothetical protein
MMGTAQHSLVHVQWDGDEPYIPVSDTIRITPARPNDVARWVRLRLRHVIIARSLAFVYELTLNRRWS